MGVADSFFETLRQSKWIRTKRCWVGGVCGAISLHTGIDIALIRGVCAFLSLFFSLWPLLPLAYAIAWLLLPDERGQILAQDILSGRILSQHLGALGLLLLTFLGAGVSVFGTWTLGWFGLVISMISLLVIGGIVAWLITSSKNASHFTVPGVNYATGNRGESPVSGMGKSGGNVNAVNANAVPGAASFSATPAPNAPSLGSSTTRPDSQSPTAPTSGSTEFFPAVASSPHSAPPSASTPPPVSGATPISASTSPSLSASFPPVAQPMAAPQFTPTPNRGMSANFVPLHSYPGMASTPYQTPQVQPPTRHVLSPVVGLVTLGLLALGLAAICFMRVSEDLPVISPKLFLSYAAFSAIVMGIELTYAAIRGKQGGWLTTLTILLAIFSFPVILLLTIWVVEESRYQSQTDEYVDIDIALEYESPDTAFTSGGLTLESGDPPLDSNAESLLSEVSLQLDEIQVCKVV